MSVPILVKIDQENATVRVPTDRRKPIFSERELSLYVVVRSSVCRQSVTFVRPTQAIEI